MTSGTTPFRWLPPAVLLLLILHDTRVNSQDVPSPKCHQDELCTTVKRCEESDESGWSGIGPRIDRSCGSGLICCEKEQLERWDASQAQPKLPSAVVRSIRDTVSRIPEPELNESCGLNMECVPRKLCQDNIISDDGFSIITPNIGQTQCSKALYRCCQIKEKKNESQS